VAFSPTNEDQSAGHPITRRGYLILRAMKESGAPFSLAQKAVAEVAEQYPDMDLDEKRTWAAWEALDG
jgi:hypothetical protein